MNAKKLSKARNLVNVRPDGPHIWCVGRMTANQAVSFKSNPWQIFKGSAK
jgi:hypothetical protein